MKKTLSAVCMLFLLAACGFEPLYAKKQNSNLWYFSGKFDNSISEEMAQISIEPIADRFGQQVRNQLLDLVTPLGAPKKPKYRLYVTPRDKQITQQALRKDITATRERVRYAVQYRLEAGGKKLLSGNSVSFVSYDILANPYSTTMAQKKTEENAAKIIANDIALRLGAYFHKEMYNKDLSVIYKQAQIEKYLKKAEPGIKVFLIYGSNEGLQAEYVKNLTAAVCPDIYDPFQVVYFNGADVNADSSMLFAEYASQSLLGGRRVIVVKDADNNLTKHLKTMLETLNSDTLVIVSAANLNKKSSLVVLAEGRDDMASVACYEDRDEDVYATVREKLVENGYTIGSEALKILCARLSNDRKTNLGEIEKLMTFMGGKKDIAVGDVERIVSDASSSSADDVCYYAAGGDSEKAQKAFRKMINEGSEPISIVRNLTYHFNKLLTVLGHMETGEPVDKAVYKLVPRIIFYREPAFKRQLGFWRKDKLLGVTELLYKCERDCKSTNMPAEEIVSYTIMQISSAAAKLQRRPY